MFCLFAFMAEPTAQAADQPNIVLIFIDDMGYGDIGPFGNTINHTPNLDRMAREGNVLRQFYVSNTACTPSRSALMTGTYAHRIGMDGSVVFPGEKRGLNPNEVTLAEILRDRGYTTGCFGKWHLGDQKPFLPLEQGFDEYFGIPYSNDMWPGNKRGNPVTKRGPYEPLPVIRGREPVAYVSDGADQSLLCEVVTDEAVRFITDHKDDPFFCYVPHAYIHNPRFARPDMMERAKGDTRRANIEEVDDSVGRILTVLRELNLANKTLVMFTSDNGGAQIGPLRGVKGGPKYEGHMREPTLTWWPGTIPAGVETEAIAATIDLLPTFAKLTGAAVPRDRTIDGKDALDVLLGKPDAQSPHPILYYETDGIRRGDWKLVKTRKRGKPFVSELYNLAADLGEQTNIAHKHPGIVKELEDLLVAHAERIATDIRPAGFVEDAKPILTSPGNLPRLREYVKKPDVRVGDSGQQPVITRLLAHNRTDTPAPTNSTDRLSRSPYGPHVSERLRQPDDARLMQLRHGASVWARQQQYQFVSLVDDRETLNARGGTSNADQHTGFPIRTEKEVAGWTVFIHPTLLESDIEATDKALKLLEHQLKEIIDVVPAPAVKELQQVPLYFSPVYPDSRPRAEYHPGAQWLRTHGRDPSMEKAVEFSNIPIFEAETRRMPNFALHELAHAYHDRVLPNGHKNKDVRIAFERAKAKGNYERVERQDSEGRKRFGRAYAMTNPQEYFAETTEAFFSRNDFFPYCRTELEGHDPYACRVLSTLWKCDQAP